VKIITSITKKVQAGDVSLGHQGQLWSR